MTLLKFGNLEEEVVTRKDFSLEQAQRTLAQETIAVLGYGIQGPGQALNLKDNGCNVIVGQRPDSPSWQKAIDDGFIPGKTLFSLEEAAEKGTIIAYLLSDAAQISCWPQIVPYLTSGKALYFSHGFGITYKQLTHINPPSDIDVIMVAPKGSGTSLRKLFIAKKGLSGSYAIYQNATHRAQEKVLAMGMCVGCQYLFPTDFEKEVYSDLTGERGALMGAIQGLFAAQYEVLRENGHSPSEAFNETVEEFTQSLLPLIAENGMDWMYANCSTTAQRGALDWWPKFRDANKIIIKEIYEEVKSGREAEKTITANSKADYREALRKELNTLKDSELWTVGTVLRSLRPKP